MATEENIEQKLENLAQAIPTEDELVENVMSRIETEPDYNKNKILIRRFIMKNRITKFAVAAVIIIAVLIGINQFGGTVNLSTIAFAEISEATKNVSWMHQISEGFERGIDGKAEQWFGFEAKIFASKPAKGNPLFINVKEHKSYTYDPQNQTITVTHVENFPLDLSSPVTMLESLNKMITEQGGEVVTKERLYNGQKVQFQEISLTSVGENNESHILGLYIQPKSKLLIAAQVKGTNANGDVIMDGEIIFSYPQTGPSSIYDLGVPQNAKIVSNLPKGK